MSHLQDNSSLYRWSFALIAEPPGPSEGDALEFIEDLGFQTSAFTRVSLIGEITCGRSVIARFEVVGSRDMLESLRTLHARYTGAATAPPARLALGPSRPA